MTKDEALKLALEALEDIGDEWGFTSQRTVPKRKEAITAIKEALAQPEQEPVAWFSTLPDGKLSIKIVGKPTEGNWEPLYTTPPQRKPLTHPQIHEFDWPDGVSFDDILSFVRAIEAAHGIKE